MAKSRMDVTAFVGKLLKEDDPDALREGVQVLARALMEAEVSAEIGAQPTPHPVTTRANYAWRNAVP